ncbi:MAG: hypothetical protein ACI8Z5_001940, partial [Lentimonas sp.]
TFTVPDSSCMGRIKPNAGTEAKLFRSVFKVS